MQRRWLILIPALALGLLPFQNCGPAPTSANRPELWSSVITSQELPLEACQRLGLKATSDCYSSIEKGQYLIADPTGSGDLFCLTNPEDSDLTPEKKVAAYLCR